MPVILDLAIRYIPYERGGELVLASYLASAPDDAATRESWVTEVEAKVWETLDASSEAFANRAKETNWEEIQYQQPWFEAKERKSAVSASTAENVDDVAKIITDAVFATTDWAYMVEEHEDRLELWPA